jgi:hypothetical protein
MTTGSRRILHQAALTVAICAVWAPPSMADVVELTTGQRIVGVIKGMTPQGLVIDVQGQERVVAQRLVRGLAFGPVRPAPPPSGTAPAPAAVATPAPVPAPAEPSPAPTESTAARSAPAPTSATPEPAPPKPEPAPAATTAPRPRPTESAEPTAAPALRPPEPEAAAPPPTTVKPAETGEPKAPPRPTIVLAKLSPTTLRDAMQALFDLRAASVPSASPKEYAARVAQAQPRIDRYLRDDGDTRLDVKKTVGAAMRLYSFAAAAWTVYAEKGDFASVGRNAALTECPQLRQAIERDAADWKFKADDPAFAGLIAGSEGLPDLWACASDWLASAERLLGGPQ